MEAVTPLLLRHPNYKILFVGAGPSSRCLSKTIEQRHLGQQALLTGPVKWDRMGELYGVAHVFATASLSEVHPMTLIEAAMCGLPVVARRDDGYVDLVKSGYNGYLVDADRQIAEKVTEILDDEATRLEFSLNAATLSRQFSIETHVDKLESLYNVSSERCRHR